MKRKITLSLLALFFFSAAGAIIATVYIKSTTATLGRLIQLHQISELRQHLVISIQTVQSELFTIGTALGHDVDIITDNVASLEVEARKCTHCHEHHTPDVITSIGLIETDIRQYETAISHYLTASADRARIAKLKLEAGEIGNRLLVRTERMSVDAAKKLDAATKYANRKIEQVQSVLYASILISLLLGIAIAVNLTRTITRPIGVLVNATRALAEGDLGHTIEYRDKTEFGELAARFNSMSVALRESYAKLEREIGERRQAQESLAHSEAFLNRIFDSIRDPFCIFDRSFRIVRANDAYAELKRQGVDRFIGKVCHSFFENSDAVCKDCVVEKAFISGDACAKEKRVVTPDDGSMWLAIYTYPIQDSQGAITHVIEYVQDITPRKLAEEALRESEERYALAARGANDGLWDWDLRTNRIYYSHRWKSMLGLGEREVGDSPEEWLGRVHRDDREAVEAKIAAHLSGKNPHFECEYRAQHRNGTTRWMLSRGLAVRDAEGKAARMAGSQTDITDRKHAEEQLLHDAFHDTLTGLPNRALFQDRLAHILLSYKRHPRYQYAVLFLDLDRFKVVNDSMGHGVGDILLIEVGNRLTKCLRPGDTVARLGGDEFAILLEDIQDTTDAADVAGRILKDLAVPFFINDNEVIVTVSIGVALRSDRYDSPDQILRDADIAMYQAKTGGKARYEFFDTTMHANVLDRLQLEADLRLAVEHSRGFVMHYQPIINMKERSLIGFEALLRWMHPTRGIIYPLQFISIAEETGMIVPLSEWIIRTACTQLRTWHLQYAASPPLKMSVNISSKHFLQPGFGDQIAAILAETGVPAGSLALEITESIIMENTEVALVTMDQLQRLGIHIHLDDFGTGYSSLSYLQRLPVNALKIDRSFISKMSNGEENREIVRAIISLARNLNMEVIAEGVEEPGQLAAVTDLECRLGQGFLFARPMDSAAVDDWISANPPQRA